LYIDRCAFVIDEDVVGLLTAWGILGEKLQQHLRFTGVSRDNALIKDIIRKSGDRRMADIKDIGSFSRYNTLFLLAAIVPLVPRFAHYCQVFTVFSACVGQSRCANDLYL
jgi:hypothetical protein